MHTTREQEQLTFRPRINAVSRRLSSGLAPLQFRQQEENEKRAARLARLTAQVAEERHRGNEETGRSLPLFSSCRKSDTVARTARIAEGGAQESMMRGVEEDNEARVADLWSRFADVSPSPSAESTGAVAMSRAGVLQALASLGFTDDMTTTALIVGKFLRALRLESDQQEERERVTGGVVVVEYAQFRHVLGAVLRAASSAPASRQKSQRCSPTPVTMRRRLKPSATPITTVYSPSMSAPARSPSPPAPVQRHLNFCEDKSEVEKEEKQHPSNTACEQAESIPASASVAATAVVLQYDEHSPVSAASPPPSRERKNIDGNDEAEEIVEGGHGLSSSPPERRPVAKSIHRTPLAADSHLLASTKSFEQKRAVKKVYDPMAECTFAPVINLEYRRPSPSSSSPPRVSPVQTPLPSQEKKQNARGTRSTTAAGPLSPVPHAAGFDKAVQRMLAARARASPAKLLKQQPKVTLPQPPVLLHVEVELPDGGMDRIAVREGDTIAQLTARFADAHGLDDDMRVTLREMLLDQVRSVRF